jgi:L-asparaginase
MSSEQLAVFATGGTIDKIYFDALSEFQVGETALGAILREAGVAFPFEITSLMRKDSLDMTLEDRAIVRRAVLASPARRMLVTHGTDTMIETAIAVGDPQGRTVVFTGAMQPASLRSSDAVFNVGFAIAAARLLPAGVYLAMNGEIFDPEHTRKNRSAMRFEPVVPPQKP